MNNKRLLPLSISVTLACGGAPAALADQGISIIPGVGYYHFDDNLKFKDTGIPSIGIQYQLNNHIAVEANYATTETEEESNGNDFDWTYSRVDAFYNFNPIGNRLVPYLSVGAGEGRADFSDTVHDETLVNAGAGIRFMLDKGFSIIADLRGINSVDNENTSGLASVGFSYKFGLGDSSSGGEFEISQIEETDSDGDGILDNTDECANTPAGVAVGANGCGLDGDLDGVADYQDQCAQTPAQVKVDAQGCPEDLDQDGIADANDQCPDSSKGQLVDQSGCDLQLSQKAQFEFNSAELTPEFKDSIAELATFMKRYAQTIAVIEGHSDNSGDPLYNEQLSELRAQAIKEILVNQFGIDPSRLEAKGYGDSKPIASNDTREGRIQNRRAVARIIQQ